MPTVLLDIHDDGVALVTLNRPDSLNSMGEDLLPRLAGVLAACEADAAVGAGFSLAQACDLRIASDRAKFGTAFRNVGLSGDFGGTYFLARLVGPGRARELYFSAEILDAEHAHALGIVNRVVPHDALLSEGLAICAELAEGPTAAFGRMKRNLNLGETGTLAEVLRQEAVHMAFSRFDDDHREAVRAFVEKRKPRFTGH